MTYASCASVKGLGHKAVGSERRSAAATYSNDGTPSEAVAAQGFLANLGEYPSTLRSLVRCAFLILIFEALLSGQGMAGNQMM